MTTGDVPRGAFLLTPLLAAALAASSLVAQGSLGRRPRRWGASARLVYQAVVE